MKIIYIASAGRSGSTLLDIVLGSKNGVLSTGELSFLTDPFVLKEQYCACSQKVSNCELWSKVLKEWEERSDLGIVKYDNLVKKYFRNKSSLGLVLNYLFPSNNFLQLIKDTRILLEIIEDISGVKTIVDSSKTAQRILLYRKLGLDLTVIRLKREFKAVRSSVNKEFSKDLNKGIEKDYSPMKFHYVAIIWLLDTYLPLIFSLGLKLKKLSYEKFVSQPHEQLDWYIEEDEEFKRKLVNRGPFDSEHLVAGNRMRMGQSIFIKGKQN